MTLITAQILINTEGVFFPPLIYLFFVAFSLQISANVDAVQ